MTRIITTLTILAAALFTQQQTHAAAAAVDFTAPGQKADNPICIDLTLDKNIDLLDRKGIASLDLNKAFDHVKPTQKNRMFGDIRPNRFLTSNIS